MDSDRPLKILAFLDGKPGHEKQTKGILSALSSLTLADYGYRYVPSPKLFSTFGAWLRYLYSYGLGGKVNKEKNRESSSFFDFIIGTGTHTHIPMLLTKKATGSKVLTCMSPSPFLIREFDLCFVPKHDELPLRENVFVTVGPPNASPYTKEKDPKKGLILVGGIDRKSHVWRSEDTAAQIRTILERDKGKFWTIGTSPRTPNHLNLVLDKLAEEHSYAAFYTPQDTYPGWIEDQYKECGFVWVTADSISMIYEPLTAGCQVGILPVQWKAKKSKFHRSVTYVLEHGLAISYEQWLEDEGVRSSQSTRLNEAARCAEEILKRWWPERLL